MTKSLFIENTVPYCMDRSYRDCREPSFPNLIAISSSHLKVLDMSLTISYSTEKIKVKYIEKVL